VRPVSKRRLFFGGFLACFVILLANRFTALDIGGFDFGLRILAVAFIVLAVVSRKNESVGNGGA
jgi:hypothetical protein